jgi:DNA repair protein RecO
VILKTGRSGETSKLVTFLGRDGGKIKLIGKGAMSPKSPFRGALEAGNLLEVLYYYKEGRTLFFVKEAHVVDTLSTGTLDRMAASLAALQLLDQVCYWGSPESRIVDLVEEYLSCSPVDDPLFAYLAFELRLLDVLGALPHLDACGKCGAEIRRGQYYPAEGSSRCSTHAASEPLSVRLDEDVIALVGRLITTPLSDSVQVAVPPAMRKRLGKLVHWTYTYHVHGYSLPDALKLISKARHH